MSADDIDALAGEYVLGTLEAREAAEVAARLATDPALAAAVAAWEARLAPLAGLSPEMAPPEDLWDRVEGALDASARPALRLIQGSAPAAWPRAVPVAKSRWLLRGWAMGSTALAAGLAAFLLVKPPEEPRLMTVLLSSSEQPAWLVEAAGGAISLASVNRAPVAPDRVLQLWALPQGATAPTSLGLLPADGRFTVTPRTIRPEPGMLIEISLEPPGGSPGPRPSGPVLFIGRLAAARGA
ncbi:anti-sigma-K factor RskA [Humitalea rosea]|uniref:Regulator of SigK n=1 Tax=Humitalea rosea TaxID=990373 RepID=A0A2W7I6K1_9PROT|nr:anti-sigma factor [Humitalea rosea]PZW41102.1 anti-sigma-K factor RskA [Humitalea rosea]